jgi:hypothetical protein
MAKAKQKGIPVTVQGTMWGRDVTVGREPGAAVSIQPSREYTKLSVVTTKVKTPTAAALAQRDLYCDCDKLYKTLTSSKRYRLDYWFRAIRNKPYDSVNNYTVFMKFCLKNRPELPAFLYHQYCTYFTVMNTELWKWVDRCVVLFGFPYAREDGTDVAVYQISGIGWKEGRKTFEPYMIKTALVSHIPSPGRVQVDLSGLMPGQGVTLAVYSYHP